MCIPRRHQDITEAYLAGYQAGIDKAPAVVVGSTSRTNVSYGAAAGVESCTFSSDCGEDMSCRSWQGSNVCMGYGGHGAPCWFGSDCLSGSCRMRSGSTAKTCK